MKPEIIGMKIHVRGIVQGVGFRPFVYSLAVQNQLTGWVCNTSRGVEIEINGSAPAAHEFLRALRENPPPLARIDKLEYEPIQPDGFDSFEIVESKSLEGQFIPISPDISICPDCQSELFNPQDRRYRYPFINCTNCGPRFSIIKDIPYDRPRTTMAGFPLCPDCQSEYDDPLNRRFHAQPVACPECGPTIWLENNGKPTAEHDNAIHLARQWLAQGKILAIKGLGGYHLACDANNSQAVSLLRERKKRSDKPFALMSFNLEAIQRNCYVSEDESRLLTSRQKPIVLLEKKPGSRIATEAAPGQNSLGVMIAYTPLHLLLMEPGNDFPELLVMTSGNLSEEPVAYRDDDAVMRLSPLADAFLIHNRPIHMRVDDSVLRIYNHQPYMIRRARGYAPESLSLTDQVPPILAVGAELKNTFCLAKDTDAFLSHHIGDMENMETMKSFGEGIEHYQRLFRINPESIACDLHPDYLSTRYAHERANSGHLQLISVQHHHAHLAACLADNQWKSEEPVIGLTFDGSGYGTDGTIWGGEFIYGNYLGYQRLAHLKYAPMPGGELAIHHPARMALTYLRNAGQDWEPDLPPVNALCASERVALASQITYHINTPLTSSMGRLFDAVSSLLDIRHISTYEGQAAVELENSSDPDETGFYTLAIENGEIDPSPLLEALIRDWRGGESRSVLAARFHNSIAQMCVEVCLEIRKRTGCNTVALSGGVWQNMLLLAKTHKLLEDQHFTVLIHHNIPTNDGGIAMGQALIAAAFINSSTTIK